MNATRPECLYIVTGDTYPVRDQLHAMGGLWSSQARAWYVPAEHVDEARTLAGGSRVSRTATAAIVASEQPQLATPDPVAPVATVATVALNARVAARPVATADASGSFVVRDVMGATLPRPAAAPVAAPAPVAPATRYEALATLKGARLSLHVQAHGKFLCEALGFATSRDLCAFVRTLDSKALEGYVADCLAHAGQRVA